MTEDVLSQLRDDMEQTVVKFRRELGRIRTGRASTSLLEGILVDYYGTKTPLNQLAGVTVPEPRLLLLQPYDKGALHEIERAIQQSDLGLTPLNDGKIIRIPIPELTAERRRDLVKHLHKVTEEYRVSVRNHRRDAIDMLKELEKAKEITEDDLHRAQDKVQQVTNEFIERVDKTLKAKEEEVLEV
jgi:ribosome recycling factor